MKNKIVTISEIHQERRWKDIYVPYIRLKGKYLSEFGFKPGQQLEMQITDNSIILKKK